MSDNKMAKQCKEQWLEGKCQEAEDSAKKQDTKRLYQMVKEIWGNASTKMAAIKDKDGNYWKVGLISKTDGKSTLRSCTTRLTQWTRRYYRKCHLVIDKNTWRTYLEMR